MKIKEFTRILSLTIAFTLPAGCGRDKDIPQEHAAEDEWEDEYGYDDGSYDDGSYDYEYEDYEEPEESDPLKAKREEVWNEYVSSHYEDAMTDLNNGYIKYGDATMRFTGEIFGDEDNSGIPMYIFLISIFSRYKRQQKLPEISTINSFA